MAIDEEWRERVGRRLMHAMVCTHRGDDFGDRAVCVTCFENVQRIGALIEEEAARSQRRAQQCNWTACRSAQTGKCFAWCKCHCHTNPMTEGI